MTVERVHDCALCASDGGVPIWRGSRLRLVRATEQPGLPAFYRIIWNVHRAEFSDLDAEERTHCLHAVVIVEQTLRSRLQPDKINLASLGNVVPHLHWHVVARFKDDSHFPDAVWAAPRRASATDLVQRLQATLPGLDADLRARLHAWDPALG